MPRPTDARYLAAEGMKCCTKCEQVKPVSAFYARGASPDGYRNDCRECVKSRGRQYYEANSEHSKTQARAWYSENRDRAISRQREWYDRTGREEARERRRQRTPEEREQAALAQRARRAADPERYRKYERARRLRGYGLTVEQYDALLAAQGSACGICGGSPNGRGTVFHVDHDHETGAVRGLLCHYCNTALGAFREDTALLLAAVSYLRNPPAAR